MVSPINDSVQEQQVISNVYDAQYERGGEGVVTLITKSGSAAFHSEVYDLMCNDGLDANTWSGNNSGSPRGKFHRNQFGANVGGPLWSRHELLFFGGYEGLRQPETDNSGLQTMPTQAEVSGDFSNTYLPSGQLDCDLQSVLEPLVTASDSSQYYTRDPFPGNQIPSGMIDQVGAKIGLERSGSTPNFAPTSSMLSIIRPMADRGTSRRTFMQPTSARSTVPVTIPATFRLRSK